MTDYAVTLFEQHGTGVTVPCDDNQEARDVAECMRPPCGASYVHEEGRELVFKPYKLSSPGLRPRPNTTRRHSAAQIEAAAKRFERDGEHENAAQMRRLVI